MKMCFARIANFNADVLIVNPVSQSALYSYSIASKVLFKSSLFYFYFFFVVPLEQDKLVFAMQILSYYIYI